MLVKLSAPRGVRGTVGAPPSKSMAHRAVLCAALAAGGSHVTNLAFSKDISATLGAATQLCAEVRTGAQDAQIRGLGRWLPVSAPVDCCESGSTLRFLIPLFALSGQAVTFTGRGRLMARPQSVYEEIFRAQGLPFAQSESGLSLQGPLTPGDYTLAGDVSSQFISGLLFALPLLPAQSTLHLLPPVESRSYIEMTRAAQKAFGVESRWADETTLVIPGGQTYRPCDYTVEGDYSQAAFLAVLGAVCGDITITGLAPAGETLQGDAAVLDILRRCGAAFTQSANGDVTFARAPLHGVEIDLADCPDLGPVLMVLAMFCEGETTIRNAGRLRIKESDRIAAMEAELHRCGGRITSDGGTIRLAHSALHAPATPFEGHNDHRIVMSMAVLTLAAGFSAYIDGAEAVTKSWPDFFDVIKTLGAESAEIERIGGTHLGT
jgi:3-phosphoshikimate 1-carboxyvinyltransferase